MSKETIEYLNSNTLIGMTDQRGRNAWHYRADVLMSDGLDNHYPGPIPVADVERRLFSWNAIDAPVSVTLPADIDTMTGLDASGRPVRVVEQPDRKAIVRDDTGDVFGIFKSGYQSHQPREWLLHTTSNLLGDSLIVSSAGQLRNGAQCWVEISVPETMHNARTGYEYRPNLLAVTSFDGSIATTYGRTVTSTVCDNTMGVALLEMGDQKVKIRHSSKSLGRIGEAREALNFVEQVRDDFDAEIDALAAVTVTDVQLFKFLDAWQGEIPADKGPSRTIAERKRDELVSLYRNDVRVSPWSGTALGVLQMANTHLHHLAPVKGASRADRNTDRAITGKMDVFDAGVLKTLDAVLANA